MGYKKDKAKRFLEASKALREKQHTYQTTRTQADKEKWESARATFDSAEWLYEQTRTHANALRFHNYGNKAGKRMSRLIKAPHNSEPIHAMRGTDGTIHTDPIKINKALTDYFTDPGH